MPWRRMTNPVRHSGFQLRLTLILWEGSRKADIFRCLCSPGDKKKKKSGVILPSAGSPYFTLGSSNRSDKGKQLCGGVTIHLKFISITVLFILIRYRNVF